MNKIFLKKGRDEAVRRFHPWIFSGAVGRTEGVLQDGDLVEVLDHKNIFEICPYPEVMQCVPHQC